MGDYRPELKIEKTAFRRICNVIGYGLFVIGVIISIGSIPFLPETVPIHFNLAGDADGWGSKYFLLVLPLIGIITTVALEAVENRPHMHNFPVSLNESNVEAFYKLSTRTMNLMKNGILVLFSFLMIDIVMTARTEEAFFQEIILFLLVAIIIIPILSFFVSMRKVK